MKNKTLFTFLLLCIGLSTFAQQGYLRGKIVDETTGEALFGATVVKQGTTVGAVADFDGNYNLSLPGGTHTIVFQSVGFQNIVIEDVAIEDGESTVLEIVMKEDVQQLGEVVVTAQVVRDNEVGVMLVQKKSINTLNGISSATFRKIGDSDLSGAMKRVTGVSVQGDKYVYVRGLGDRYTKTSINGMIIPGLDPDRNDVQIDIFPTGILENVLVYKTFTPDLTGSFTGGLIDIQTKSFPEEKSSSISFSLGFNPDMHFNSDYLSYKGSSTDFIGFDNGQRELPVTSSLEIPQDNQTTNLFDPTLAGTRNTSPMNTSFSFSHRNQIVGKKFTWGYNALFTYRNRINYFEGFERRRYERDGTGEEVELVRDYTAKGDLSTNESLWSGLVSLAAKTQKSTIGTNFLHIQNGVSSALDRTRSNTSLNNPTFLYNDILTYVQRQMTNSILFGKHQLNNRLKLSWTNSLIFSKQYEPDYRETAINEDEGQLGFRNGGLINRFWRNLSEVNESFRVDIEFVLNKKNKLKFGGTYTYRDRDFDVYNYSYGNLLTSNVDSTDPNDLLPENAISPERPTGLFIQNATDPSNAYDGKQNLTAGYLMNEMSISDKLKSIYGVRLETVNMFYTGVVEQDDGSQIFVENQKTLSEANLLPSLSLIYNVNDDMNLRASFNKTLARPSFKEKSEAFIADPITGIFFIGNIDTKQAEILNYDLRWEYFFTPGEMASLSFFYKDFTNHIAIVAFEVAPNQVTPRNVGSALAYGTEIEFIKRLGFINDRLDNLTIGGNYSYTISKVDRTTVTVSETGENEFQSEVNFRGTEQGVDRYRNLSLQAPFSINTFLNYEIPNLDLSANLSYNVQGETLTYISAARVPEVFTKPFHSLNFKVSKNINEKSMVSLGVSNVLNDANKLVYKSDNQEQLFSRQSPGRLFTLKYTYSF
ncbi:TonB-dependent receptor [Ekhidna sp.]|uniref:TonB-dependent receptor n=1 Tax=Ekhidna sp. TaxID=2608089 RepID=UPI00329986DC